MAGLTARSIWNSLPRERRARLALALWEDERLSRAERLAALAPWLAARGMRPAFLERLSRERRAELMAQGGLPEETASQVLTSWHLVHRRPLLSRFLDLLGIPHEEGVITEDVPEPPGKERLAEAVAKLREEFPPEDVDLYLRTLCSSDAVTWAELAPLVGAGEAEGGS